MPRTRTAEKKPSAQATLTRVAENLYRNQSSGSYYALLRRSGKQIKKSLKTKDLPLAKRRLRSLVNQLDRTTPTAQNTKNPFKEMGERWMTQVRGLGDQARLNVRQPPSTSTGKR